MFLKISTLMLVCQNNVTNLINQTRSSVLAINEFKYFYGTVNASNFTLSNLDLSHSTVGSSILFTRITKCLTPAVLANMACSLWRKQTNKQGLLTFQSRYTILSSEFTWQSVPCLPSFFKPSFKFTFPGWYYLGKCNQKKQNFDKKEEILLFIINLISRYKMNIKVKAWF